MNKSQSCIPLAEEVEQQPAVSFAANLLSYSTAGLLGRILRAMQEFIIRFLLPPHLLGSWSLISVLVNFSTIAELGVFSAARRELPILYAQDNYQDAAAVRSVTFNMHFLAKAIMALMVIVFCLWQKQYNAQYLQASFAAGLLILLASFGESFSCFFETSQKFSQLGLALSYYWPLYTILMIAGAYYFAVPGLIAANAIALILQGWLMRSAMFYHISANYFEWHWQHAKTILTFALPFFITDMPINIMYTLDALFIAKFFSIDALAIYTTSKMIALQAGQFPMWINNILEIRLTFFIFDKEQSKKKQIAMETFHYLVAYFLIFMPIIMVGLVDVAFYLFRNYLVAYNGVLNILPIMMVSLYFMPKMMPLRNFLLIEKRFMSLAIINYLSLLVLVTSLLYLLMAKKLSLVNVTVAYVFSFYVYFHLVLFGNARQILKIKKTLLVAMFLVVSLCTTFYAIDYGLKIFPANYQPSLLACVLLYFRQMVIVLPVSILGLFILYRKTIINKIWKR